MDNEINTLNICCNQKKKESINPICFMDYICSLPNDVINNILKTGEEIILSLKFDYDTLQSWINICSGTQEYEILTPQIPTSIMSNIYIAHKAANAQRIIDSWFNALKDSIEYNAYRNHKKVDIKIKNICIYSRNMFWKEYDKKNNITYYIAHKYIKANHPEDYIREKLFFDSLLWKEKPYELAISSIV